jgi:hypothetical protein
VVEETFFFIRFVAVRHRAVALVPRCGTVDLVGLLRTGWEGQR